jgi:hypothetical protein
MSFALLVLNISIHQFQIMGIALPFYRLPMLALLTLVVIAHC